MLFRRKKIKNETEEEIKKFPRKQRGRLRSLLKQYNDGKIIQVDNNIDNKKYLKDKEEN